MGTWIAMAGDGRLDLLGRNVGVLPAGVAFVVEVAWVDGVMHEVAANGNEDDDVRIEYIALVR